MIIYNSGKVSILIHIYLTRIIILHVLILKLSFFESINYDLWTLERIWYLYFTLFWKCGKIVTCLWAHPWNALYIYISQNRANSKCDWKATWRAWKNSTRLKWVKLNRRSQCLMELECASTVGTLLEMKKMAPTENIGQGLRPPNVCSNTALLYKQTLTN